MVVAVRNRLQGRFPGLVELKVKITYLHLEFLICTCETLDIR